MSEHRHVVFLPGFLCDERLFAPQREALLKEGIASSVGNLTTAASIERLASHVLRAAPDQFALAGLSMGGIVAFEILRQAPERVTHLALLNTTPRADRSGPMRAKQLRRVLDGEFEGVLREELKPQYLAEQNRTPELLDLLLAMGRSLGSEVFRQQTVALMGREGSEDTLASISCPTLVLAGALDSVCPPRLHEEKAAALPDARLEVLPRCGHISTLEQPHAVARHLLNFLSHQEATAQVASKEY